MNYLLVSPNFPISQEYFAKSLKEKGVTVLGVGSESYDNLSDTLKSVLTEYYKVEDMENYDEVFKGAAFLSFKHGKIDRIESNNEYWLELDAKLRQDFNVSGVKPEQLELTKYKSKMKSVFKKAGIDVAKGEVVKSKDNLTKVLKKLSLPLIAKPDNGVGAANTYKLLTQEDVKKFEEEWDENVAYFLEEFVDNGTLCTYDGLIDQNGKIAFETSFIYSSPTLDLVNDGLDYGTIIEPKINKKLKELGRKAVKEFGMKERFFHIEFFKLANDKYIALEYNNRIAGGSTVDLYNYAYNISLYDIYADVVLGADVLPSSTEKYTMTLSRRNRNNYKYSLDQIRDKYRENMRTIAFVPEVFATAMGDILFILTFDTKDEIEAATKYIQEKE